MKIKITVYEQFNKTTMGSLDYYTIPKVSPAEIVIINGEHYAKYTIR